MKQHIPYPKVVILWDIKKNVLINLWAALKLLHVLNLHLLKLSPATIVKDVTLKELLSHPSNKQVITEYLAKSCERFICENLNKTCIIANGTTLLSNVVNWRHLSHKHPEADTLMISPINELKICWFLTSAFN